MSSAQALRDRFRTPRTIAVTIPGSDLTIECRRPNLMHMVMSGLMTWPALQRVREVAAEDTVQSEGAVIDNRPLPTLTDRADAVGAMLDEWVCLAAVSPRVVMHEHEQGDEAIWVEDLPYDGREAIFNATFRVTPTAGADFRRDESGSAPPGQSGAPVRDAALDAPGHDGSDGRAGS